MSSSIKSNVTSTMTVPTAPKTTPSIQTNPIAAPMPKQDSVRISTQAQNTYNALPNKPSLVPPICKPDPNEFLRKPPVTQPPPTPTITPAKPPVTQPPPTPTPTIKPTTPTTGN